MDAPDVRLAAAQAVPRSPFLKDEPQFSPDGRWVAYNSNETGRWETYVTSFPDAQQKFPVSTSAASSRSGVPTAASCSTWDSTAR